MATSTYSVQTGVVASLRGCRIRPEANNRKDPLFLDDGFCQIRKAKLIMFRPNQVTKKSKICVKSGEFCLQRKAMEKLNLL